MTAGPGQVLFEFVRHWSRRTAPDVAEQGRLVLVVESVYAVNGRRAATINAVAHEIGIDQSGASRLVKDAAAAGYLELRAADGDARRREVSVTDAGVELLDQAHAWQEEVFAELTAGWSERRRTQFRRDMLSLLERSHPSG
ncbi:MarR family winged helix-turn-helix transcriptional regulator [Kribbella sp.]|uniref:MarR family winged helix-turn-helix transcriptional regulator n=1 Tax=Kribbella sp. TaxID=1871183 RepID=UPI002D758FEC|nr:MarR family winged helix-turn-helix transcriptional regulator [Kribbella sp.]HZX08947.1 MarR family winged helix-turn-helix transcriptional regulator [Kribbella sp.]